MKRKLLVIFLAVTALIGTVIFAACGSDEQPPVTQPPVAGEEVGEYYCDVNGGEYTLTLSDDCNFTLVMGGETVNGNYVPQGENLTLYINGTATAATYFEEAVTFEYNSATLKFIRKVDYTISFNTYGGTAVSAITVRNGRTAAKPANPTKNGEVFVGWYSDSGFKIPYNWNEAVTSSFTLHARFIQPADPEYTVTFDVNGGTGSFESVQTVGHKLFALPTPTKSGSQFIGWWVSHYGDASKLTYQYKEQELTKDTTLYAVYSGDGIAVSAEEKTISWTSAGTNVNYAVTVENLDTSDVVLNTNTLQTSASFDFATAAAGNYKITVQTGGKSGTAYYLNKALEKVTGFRVVNSTLIFDKVANAESYLLAVDCGIAGHHTNPVVIDASGEIAYDFSACEMKNGKITFTVTARAAGYLDSVSDPYEVTRTLAAVTGVEVTAATETLQWAAVDNATAYTVVIKQGGTELYNDDVVDGLSLSLKYYDKGELEISVTPKARGWNSPAATVTNYTKATLAAPKNLQADVAESTISWNSVNGASQYEVTIGDVTKTVSENSIEFTDEFVKAGVNSYVVTVRALSDNAAKSLASDPFTVMYGVLGEIRYKDGVVSWDPAFGINEYFIKINDGAAESKGKVTQIDADFTAKGEYVFSLATNAEMTDAVSVTVHVYEITFRTQGADESVESELFVPGDTVDLPDGSTLLHRFGFDFDNWYTASEGGDVYTDSKYFEERDFTLYAHWTPKKFHVTLNVGTIGESTPEIEEGFDVDYLGTATLPVPESKDPIKGFAGWYDAAAGGMAYTNADGVIAEYQDDKDITLYAKWVDVFTFTNGPQGYQVSKNSDIELTNITTLTIPAKYNDRPVTEIIDFTDCSKLEVIRIPQSIRYISIASAESAFTGCSKLRDVEIYEVADFDDDIYYTSQDGVLFYDNPVSGLRELKLYPVAHEAADYVIPDGVQVLPSNVIWNAGNLITLTIPASVTLIETKAIGVDNISFFNNINSIIFKAAEAGTEEEPLTIQDGAFYKLQNLKNVVMPVRLKNIDFYKLFTSDSGSSYKFSMSQFESVEFVGAGNDYRNVDGAIIKNDTELAYYIGDAAEIVLGDSSAPDYVRVSKIGENAFRGNSSVTSVTIGKNVENIGDYAFYGCSGITSLTFNGTADDLNLTVGDYAFYGVGASGELVLPANLTAAGEHAFGNTNYTSVSLNSNANIAAGAFNSEEGVSNVTSLTIGADVKDVNFSAVFGAGITDIDVSGNSNYEEDDYGVIYTKDWEEIAWFDPDAASFYEFHDGLKRIGAETFKNTNVDEITIPSSVTYIGDEAFANCVSLYSVIFVDGETPMDGNLVLGDRVFYGCSFLEEITLPEGTTQVGKLIFGGCSSLTTVNLPASLEDIATLPASGDLPEQFGMFFEGRNFNDGDTETGILETITVADGNTHYKAVDNVLYKLRQDGADYVEDELLYGATHNPIKKIVIPSTVTRIWGMAFYGKSQYDLYNEGYNPTLESVSFKDDKLTGKDGADSHLVIGKYAFAKCTSLKSVDLPDSGGTVEIGMFAFFCCSGRDKSNGYPYPYLFKEITIPGTVTSIGAAAFNADGLQTITFEESENPLRFEDNNFAGYETFTLDESNDGKITSLPARTTYIGENAFKGITFDTTLTIPANVEEIGVSAFENASFGELKFGADSKLYKIGNRAFASSGVTSVVIPASVAVIADQAFSGCSKLTSFTVADNANLVTLGDNSSSITFAHPSPLYNCKELQTFSLGANSKLTYIDDLLFEGCVKLGSVTIPAAVERIGDNAFAGCTQLATVNFTAGSKLRTIGDNAFANTGITEFTFPETDNAILLGEEIFGGCTSLQTVSISSKVGELNNAFSGCTGITSITVAEDNADYEIGELGDGKYLTSKNGNIIRGFGEFSGAIVIPEGSTFIGDYAFMNQSGITSLSIPASVRSIGAFAFSGCTSLQTVTLAEHSLLVSIGESAFNGCSQLADIDFTLTKNLKTIGENAFNGCEKLEVVDLSGTRIEELPGGAFAGCTTLYSLALPYTLKTIGEVAGGTIFGNTAIQTLDLSETGITEIPARMFMGSASLKNLILPDTVTKIGESAFENCTLFEGIDFATLPNLSAIGAKAFKGCAAIESVDLSVTNVKKLSSDAFDDCTALTSLTLPANLDLLVIGGTTLSDIFKTALSEVESIGFVTFPNNATWKTWTGDAGNFIKELAAAGVKRMFFDINSYGGITAVDDDVITALSENEVSLYFSYTSDSVFSYTIKSKITAKFTTGENMFFSYKPTENEQL